VDPDRLHHKEFVEAAKQRNDNIPDVPVLQVDPGDMVRPADRVAVPFHQFVEKVTGRCVDPDPVNVDQPEAVNVDPYPLHNAGTVDLLLLSTIENNIPVLTFSDKYVEKGALLSLEVDAAESGKQAGEMAVKILKGASVNSIKGEDARESILTVNLIVAKRLGISINGNVIKHARVIR